MTKALRIVEHVNNKRRKIVEDQNHRRQTGREKLQGGREVRIRQDEERRVYVAKRRKAAQSAKKRAREARKCARSAENPPSQVHSTSSNYTYVLSYRWMNERCLRWSSGSQQRPDQRLRPHQLIIDLFPGWRSLKFTFCVTAPPTPVTLRLGEGKTHAWRRHPQTNGRLGCIHTPGRDASRGARGGGVGVAGAWAFPPLALAAARMAGTFTFGLYGGNRIGSFFEIELALFSSYGGVLRTFRVRFFPWGHAEN